jgi:hypothetical protein
VGSEILERPIQAGTGARPIELVGETLHTPALERLHALVRKGYAPEIGTDTATDVVILRHVGRAPDLVLHSDGVVEGFEGRRPRYKKDIDAPPPFAAGQLSEQLRFMKFLDSVPRASLRDRTRRWRQKYIYFPIVVAILLAIHLAFTALILDDEGDPREAPVTAPAPPEIEVQPRLPA